VTFRQLAPWAFLLLVGCQEKLTAPADCPALCPGGIAQVFEEVVYPISGSDSSFRGYVQPYNSAALLASNGLQGQEQRAIMRFPALNDSVSVRDTLRSYVVDSVALSLTVMARDTNVNGLQLDLYRLPPTIDTATTFADVDPSFSPTNLVTQIPVADSVNAGVVRVVLQGPDLAKVALGPTDGGVLALGVRVNAPVITGVRLGAIGSLGGVFTTYATADIPDTGTAKLRTFALPAAFGSYVPAIQQAADPTMLSIGGEPSARAIMRFELPARIKDSANIVRATLELTPVTPIEGLPTDPLHLQGRAVLADLGAKSPVNNAAGRVPEDTVESGTSGTVSLEAVRLVEQWIGLVSQPAALIVSVAPEQEAATFSRPVFYSSLAADSAVRPRLRISYLLSFPFENP
jgi:hypothetical protein